MLLLYGCFAGSAGLQSAGGKPQCSEAAGLDRALSGGTGGG